MAWSDNFNKLVGSNVLDTFDRETNINSADDIFQVLDLYYKNYNIDGLTDIGYLDNYSEILATRQSSRRMVLTNTYSQPKNDSQRTTQDFASRTQKNAINLMASLLGRETAFQATFGAPFSYLEAVDPYGRVYKDTFGFRREEAWNTDITKNQMKTANTDSKVFSVYLKVGMVSISSGKSLAEAATKTVNAVKNLSNTVGLSDQRSTDTNQDAYKFTSFSLSYYINNDTLIANNLNKDIWEQGKVVPFNKFIRSALRRMISQHTAPSISGIEWNKIYQDTNMSKLNSELRTLIYKKIDYIFGENTMPFFKFIASEESVVNETIMNQIGDAAVKEILDNSSLISLAKEINFVTGGGDPLSVLGKLGSAVNDALGKTIGISLGGETKQTLANFANSVRQSSEEILGKNIVDNILKGNSLVYPRVWKDSYIERMLSLQMRFYSPYGDFYSIFTHIIMPMTVLSGLALPRQVSPSFVSFPFTFSIEVPGLFASEFAMVTNISIARGGRYYAWNDSSTMRGVDITLDITALKPMYGLPEEVVMVPSRGSGKEKFSNEIYGKYEGDSEKDWYARGDQTYANVLLNMSGSFIISDQQISPEQRKLLDEAFGGTEVNNKKIESSKWSTKKLEETANDMTQRLSQVYNQQRESNK